MRRIPEIRNYERVCMRTGSIPRTLHLCVLCRELRFPWLICGSVHARVAYRAGLATGINCHLDNAWIWGFILTEKINRSVDKCVKRIKCLNRELI
ncbi:hypothetical protein CDAR_164831 [Caerostris darwini]|uniref:Uncharacterized protein n=1 Tax=Caerostris darwini TaxID=1538125 RepID=A0AAV4T0K6_9ARAC|nr:hypothetical protein CDAR_164831 [Caerostris darwini]